ncbi:hypothetical protein Tco_0503223 [Tanacetum coccineum]
MDYRIANESEKLELLASILHMPYFNDVDWFAVICLTSLALPIGSVIVRMTAEKLCSIGVLANFTQHSLYFRLHWSTNGINNWLGSWILRLDLNYQRLDVFGASVISRKHRGKLGGRIWLQHWRSGTGIPVIDISADGLRDVSLKCCHDNIAIRSEGQTLYDELHASPHNFPRSLLLEREFGERVLGVIFLIKSSALTISLSSETSGEIPEVEVLVLTLATTGLLRELRTLDLLSMIFRHSRGILSKKLPPAAEFNES